MKGPGDPDCPNCKGSGAIRAPSDPRHPPVYNRCPCVIGKDIAANVERGMKRLMEAPVIKTSKLFDYLDQDLWVTADRPTFTANLRHVAMRQPPTWYFKVTTDAQLVTAWLASVAIKGGEIFDSDVIKESAKVSMVHLTLVDLVVPPELLIIEVGVKIAKNEQTPDVLLEALREREHVGKPTWVWDTPDRPLAENTRAWSPDVVDYLSAWARHRPATYKSFNANGGFADLGMGGRPSLSGATGTARPTLSDTTGPAARPSLSDAALRPSLSDAGKGRKK